MKSKIVIKFLLAIAFGALFGQYFHHGYEKWHQLGRDAFLTYEAQRFDTSMAVVSSGAPIIIVCIIFGLGLATLYEALAFSIAGS